MLTHKEVRAVLSKLEDEYRLIGSILYGGGLRPQEALQLRVKDVDFKLRQLIVRSGKGNKDRVTYSCVRTRVPLAGGPGPAPSKKARYFRSEPF